MECKRAEPKDATSVPAIGQTLVDHATAGTMVLAQGPDGSVSLVPAHAFATAAASGHGAALVYPPAAAAGVGLMSPVDLAAYRAAAGLPAEMLQASGYQQAGMRFVPSAAAATSGVPGSQYVMMGAAATPGAPSSATAGNGFVMMNNPAGASGSVFMPSALQAQSVLMQRSGLAGAGMVVSGTAGGSGYLLAGGGVPQYMMGYPTMPGAGLQLSGTTADLTAAYNAGNPYTFQMPSGTSAMYAALGKAEQTAGLVGSLAPVADTTSDKSAAATGAAQLASSYGIGLVGADASDDGTARAGVAAADNQMMAAAQMFTGAAGNRLAAVNGGYYIVPGGTTMYATSSGATYAVTSDPSTQAAYITAQAAQQSAVLGRVPTAASMSAHGYHPYRR